MLGSGCDPFGREAALTDAEAVELLIAAAIRAGADPDAVGAEPDVLRDVARLVGKLPLPLELAAAHLTMMSPRALRARLRLEPARAWSWEPAVLAALFADHAPRPRRTRSDGGGGPAPRVLFVDAQARWFQLDGGPAIACGRRALLQRLLLALARARIDAPGQPVSARALLAAGWPEESMLPRAAQNRLHVALHRLRRLGLGDVLRCEPGGWLLAAGVALELRDAPAPELQP
jgi:hypothetical protein